MALSSDALPDFRPETVRGAAGFFRVARTHAGQWWVIDPADRPFFMKAVHGVAAQADSPHDPAARLRRWGFNTLGCGSERLDLEEGLAFVRAVNFAPTGAGVNLAGARLPDVFESAWPVFAGARAGEVCAPLAENRHLVGWLTDDGPNWPVAATDRPGLLQICLSLEPDRAAYHAAWEFVLALHGGSLSALATAWRVQLANKETLRTMTKREEGIVTPGYLGDEERWTEEFARRYFSVVAAAIRRHAPFHLVLGCRWAAPVSAGLRLAGADAVDVCCVDYDDLAANPAGPVIIGDFSWVKKSFIAEIAPRRSLGPTAVERMLRRGRLGLSRAVAHPAVVGYAWSHWRDRAGEQAPFGSGLVRKDDVEACEHTELLTAINDRVEELRAMALPEEETIS
ncbi:MAG: hypothetical protein IT582_03895 [Opitutaceae bacterium]|nr:hypothetical protein [Opitutaceae bacterium]